MTLTFSLVVNRLDQLNHRERQVKKFYKPLAPSVRNKPSSAARHRFADALEPGDVVKTIRKGDDWEEDEDLLSELSGEPGGGGDGTGRNATGNSNHRAGASGIGGVGQFAAIQPRRPSLASSGSDKGGGRRPQSVDPAQHQGGSRRDSWDQQGGGGKDPLGGGGAGRPSSGGYQAGNLPPNHPPEYAPLAPAVSGDIERAEGSLLKTVQERFAQRKEQLKTKIFREVGLNDDGTVPDPDAPPLEPVEEAGVVPFDSLFRPPAAAQGRLPPQQAKKKPDMMKTGLASAKELAVYETAYVLPQMRENLLREMELKRAEKAGAGGAGGAASTPAAKSVRRGSGGAGAASGGGVLGGGSMHLGDEEGGGPGGVGGGGAPGEGGEMDTWEEEDEGQAPELDGDDPSMWRYQRTHLGSQDDPEKREFYLVQVRLPEGSLLDPSRAFRVTVSSGTLPGCPSHTFEALGADEQGRILFPRALPNGQVLETTALSPADDLELAAMPYDLLGHTLNISVEDAVTAEHILERTVEYRLPAAHPSTLSRTAISSPGPKLPARPMTYRLSPSRLHNQSSYSSAGSPGGRPSTAPSPGLGHPGASFGSPGGQSRPASRGSPSKWGAQEGAYDPDAPDEASLSPRERKRRELARMRAQMKASLQQTQSQAAAAVQGARLGGGGTRLMSAGQLRSPNESLLGLGQDSFAGGDAAPPMIVSQAPTNKVGPRPGSSMREIRSP